MLWTLYAQDYLLYRIFLASKKEISGTMCVPGQHDDDLDLFSECRHISKAPCLGSFIQGEKHGIHEVNKTSVY